MPRATGYKMNVTRLDRERSLFDYEYNGERVRGEVMLAAITALIRGQVDEESNLAPAAQPMLFADFANEKYGPVAAVPRFDNPISLKAELNLVKAVGIEVGKTYLHEFKAPDLEALKTTWLTKKVSTNTIKRRLNALRRVLNYAVATGMIQKNPLPLVTGLRSKSRAEIWLRTEEFDRLLLHCHPTIRLIVEYLGLTGARIREALSLQAGDLRDGRLFVPTEKRGLPCREIMREFNTASLGRRWARLERQLTPHPKSGYYFHANERDRAGERLSYSHFQRLFAQARLAAGLPHIKPHDLRGSFAIHRAMVVQNFRQLQIEMGHGDSRSIESYLARAQSFNPTESYFYVATAAPTATAAPVPAASPAQVPAKPALPEPSTASLVLQ